MSDAIEISGLAVHMVALEEVFLVSFVFESVTFLTFIVVTRLKNAFSKSIRATRANIKTKLRLTFARLFMNFAPPFWKLMHTNRSNDMNVVIHEE